MPQPIQIADRQLDDSPLGRFCLAVATAVNDLELGFTSLSISSRERLRDDEQGPKLVIVPREEQPAATQWLGKFNLMLRCELIDIERDDPDRSLSPGWRLKTRHAIAQEIAGLGTAGSSLTYGGDCFKLEPPEFGPLMDEGSRRDGLIRSVLSARGTYHG